MNHTTAKKKNYWVSWYHTPSTDGAFTLYWPWWISGCTFEEPPRDTICAAIKAQCEHEARELILSSYDNRPDIEFRFISEKEADWSPFSERFPLADWMTPYWEALSNS